QWAACGCDIHPPRWRALSTAFPACPGRQREGWRNCPLCTTAGCRPVCGLRFAAGGRHRLALHLHQTRLRREIGVAGALEDAAVLGGAAIGLAELAVGHRPCALTRALGVVLIREGA